MKILIHTLFYQNYNYGGILQAYALYSYLTSQGNECIELNYVRSIKKSEWIVRRIKNILEMISAPQKFINKLKIIKKEKLLWDEYIKKFPDDPMKKNFDLFIKENFNQTRLYNSQNINTISEQFDCCITGGDQMWNPMWYDKNFYLKFSNKKNIAYSCSVGKDILTNGDERKILEGIKNIDHISVREKNIFKWFEQQNVRAELVCDPVFLLSKKEWENFATNDLNINSNYLFAYLLGDNEEERIQARKLADRLCIDLVLIPHVKRRYNKYDENIADYAPIGINPKEFIGLIKNADYIVTDSFHGTAFSIIFEKKFVSISRFKKNDVNSLSNRIMSVLELFNLKDRYVDTDEVGKLSAESFENFKRINSQLIKDFSDSGKKYLNSSLM